tara:strand:- start:6024 stop:7139 length:1116 start_codon:yes stop_codon:yes gene_type:complete
LARQLLILAEPRAATVFRRAGYKQYQQENNLIRKLSIALALALATAAQPALSDSVEDFYSGRTVTAVIPSSSGGSFDAYMRLMADHLGKFIPGNPNIVPQNMPGGGGVKALNYVYNVAPKDGTYLGMPIHTTLTFGLLNPKRVKFEGPKFNWIGSMAGIHDIIGVWQTTGVKTVGDARTKVVNMGATGRGGNTFLDPVMANNLLGTKFKVIAGYPGASEINLAIERGELGGRASSWEGLISKKPDWFADKKFVTLVQIGPDKVPELGDVPSFKEVLQNPDDEVIVDVLSVGLTLGRALFTTPGTPPERVAALRAAFEKMVKDPAYLADAKKYRMSVHDPKPGAQIQDIVSKTYQLPKAVLAKAKEALTPKK